MHSSRQATAGAELHDENASKAARFFSPAAGNSVAPLGVGVFVLVAMMKLLFLSSVGISLMSARALAFVSTGGASESELLLLLGVALFAVATAVRRYPHRKDSSRMAQLFLDES